MSARPGLSWNLLEHGPGDIEIETDWPAHVTRDWAWGGATGRGVRVCVVDSGVEPGHPMIGRIHGNHAVRMGIDGEARVSRCRPRDGCGHGTACASIIRSIAPECELYSVRVLDQGFGGTGQALLAGLRWAVRQRFDIINLSLSTNRGGLAGELYALADEAYFAGCLLVASAHNLPVESFPWRFASVISVGSHGERDPSLILYNPAPPVEFFGHGVDVEVAWPGGGSTRCSGNSFAAPHVSGYCALIRSAHPRLTPFQVKSLLYLTAANVRGDA
ncbi:S8 family serine peptidase [Spongiactinospora sp. TRM90649]|uniref:S8 family peptidase n=1 Tax=Spongiactinospora sp. TRM90649 TaxID=3031114 RepID=UPI0023F7D530|nr:S8 family serine peptidase [Spongiactinospora sp. TRM90649]MDF5759105.1 S8 family serine peptidase [Spongiactinospora sp. TRM90649]